MRASDQNKLKDTFSLVLLDAKGEVKQEVTPPKPTKDQKNV